MKTFINKIKKKIYDKIIWSRVKRKNKSIIEKVLDSMMLIIVISLIIVFGVTIYFMTSSIPVIECTVDNIEHCTTSFNIINVTMETTTSTTTTTKSSTITTYVVTTTVTTTSEVKEEYEYYNEEYCNTYNNMTYLGELKITGYIATGNPTASGDYPYVGGVAMNTSYGLSYGTTIYIEDLGYYTLNDTGCAYGVVDVFCNSEQECYNLTSYHNVYVVD